MADERLILLRLQEKNFRLSLPGTKLELFQSIH